MVLDLDDTLYPRGCFVRSGFAAVAGYVAASWDRDRDAVLATLVQAHEQGRAGSEFQALCEREGLPLNLVPSLVARFRTHTPAITLCESVRAMLARLRAEGWRLVVLTNGNPDVQRRKVNALGIEGLVDAVVYAEEHAPSGKPGRGAFTAALARLRLPSSRCVCVGDDPVCDIEGARGAGLRTVRVAVAGREADGSVEADAVAVSVEEIPVLAASLIPEIADVA